MLRRESATQPKSGIRDHRRLSKNCLALSLVALASFACSAAEESEGVAWDGAGDPVGRTPEQEAAFDLFLSEIESVSEGYLYQGDIFIPMEVGIEEFYSAHVEHNALMRDGMAAVIESDLGPEVEIGNVRTTQQSLSLVSSGIQSRRDLTYCIRTGGSNSFTTTQAGIVQARLAQAAGLWNADTNVTFTHVPAEDSLCDADNDRVFFHVRPLTATEQSDSPTLRASAFFPGWSRGQRVLKINPPEVVNTTGFRGLLAHELGHVLGFVHEHDRDSRTGCADGDFSGTGVTRYDANSIMHYNWCNGSTRTTLSTYDQRGARCGYLNQCEWILRPGTAIDIAAGGGQVWIVGENRRPYRYNSNNTWQQMVGSNGSRIAVSESGVAWLVNTANDIYRFNGTSWVQMPGEAIDIAAGAGAVWIIGANRKMYSWNNPASRWNMMAAGSNGSRITIDNAGVPWIVTTSQDIYRRAGNGWSQIPGKGRDIGASANGSVWLVGNSTRGGGNTLYEFEPSSGPTDAPEWVLLTGGGTNIAADDSGTPWLVNSSLNIYENRWE